MGGRGIAPGTLVNRTKRELRAGAGGKGASGMRRVLRLCIGSLAVSAVLLLVGVGPASAQVYVGVPPPSLGEGDPGGGWHTATPGPAPDPGWHDSGSYLAVTGGDILGLCILSLGALAAGVALTRLGRRTSP